MDIAIFFRSYKHLKICLVFIKVNNIFHKKSYHISQCLRTFNVTNKLFTFLGVFFMFELGSNITPVTTFNTLNRPWHNIFRALNVEEKYYSNGGTYIEFDTML